MPVIVMKKNAAQATCKESQLKCNYFESWPATLPNATIYSFSRIFMDMGGKNIMPLTGDKIKFGAHAETFQTFMIIEFYLLLFWLSFNWGSSLEDIKQSWT